MVFTPSKGKLLKSDDSTIVDQINYGDGVDVCAPNSGESSGRKPNGSSNLVRFSGQTKDSSNGDAENSCPSPSPTPTPTPSPSPSPSPSPNPSPSPVIKISPSPSPLKKFEVTNLENSQSTGSSLMMLASKSGEVKGASEASQAGKTNKTWIIAVVLILMGLGLIGGVGVVIYKDQKYNSTDVGKSVKKKAGKEKN